MPAIRTKFTRNGGAAGTMSASLDALDTRILTLLQADGRMSNSAVARRLGVGEAAVRKRIARMRRDDVIQFQAWVDPLKIGYRVYAILEIQVEPPAVERVAERLAELPEIYFLGVCTGAFDIFAAAVFRSNEHLYAFLTKRLNLVPGITRTSTSSIVRVVRREFRFLLRDDAGDGATRGRRPAARRPRPARPAATRKREPV
jgi:Lrp/AsnC family transcriptional regulator for asnA, asnC and gidA